MPEFHYWLVWEDEAGREWALRHQSDSPQAARREHEHAKAGHWVQPGMRDPVVSTLFVRDGNRTASIASGSRPAEIHTPPSLDV
jgi:hypothetical protein